MSIGEIAALIAAGAAAVLVLFLIPPLLRLRDTLTEAQRLLAQTNTELPLLLRNVRMTTERANLLTGQLQSSLEHAAVLLHAVGEVGSTVQDANYLIRRKTNESVINLASVAAGVRAATNVLKQRFFHPGGYSNGG